MVGKIKAEKIVHVYHDSMDWMIRKNRGRFWYREVDRVVWQPGVPPGMEEGDVELLFR
jgi:hypothetical protein